MKCPTAPCLLSRTLFIETDKKEMPLGDILQREKKIKSPVRVKEEPVASPPESSSTVTGDVEAPQSLKKGPWTAEEDAILMEYVKKHGEGNWNAVQKNIGLQRCGKSCRLRWANHLRPNLKKGSFSREEENLIIQLHAELGNKWAQMATKLPGRTDNEIKNYWNTRVKRRQRAGLPLYPPEIQSQLAFMKKRQRSLMHMQNQVQPKDFISHNSLTTTTLFNNGNIGNGETNYLSSGSFNVSLQCQQLESSTFPIKTEHSSTKLYPSCISDQKVTPQSMPLVMGQENNALFDDMLQESQGPREISNERLLYKHLSTNGIAMVESLPSLKPPPPSNTKHLAINPPYKLSNSNIPIGLPPTKQSVDTMINQNSSNLSETKLIDTTPMPATEFYDSSSVMMTNDNLRLDMQHIASNFSMTDDWKFESSSWENTPGIG
ncbi:hypothetical protein IEQ34_003734 [Dendrobium chrysotoxum]|uniref:Transcription factor GAMYB n=1 Tax=Dendrobium chrysotoxum TaxID=161865 RepID=A0AAV7HC67_DENCH|nr:hypothetical protein IEQ34_003734 [Dendrobium chrysotoxum]